MMSFDLLVWPFDDNRLGECHKASIKVDDRLMLCILA